MARRSRQEADTSTSEDLVQLYLADFGRHPLLTKADEVRLSRRIQDGLAAAIELAGDPAGSVRTDELLALVQDGEAAKREFVNANLRLVVSIAKRYQSSSGLSLLDLVQEGNLGLLHAVEKFDWRKGFKFSTYATWWIRQAIHRGIANTGRTIRLPVHATESVRRLTTVQIRLEHELRAAADGGGTGGRRRHGRRRRRPSPADGARAPQLDRTAARGLGHGGRRRGGRPDRSDGVRRHRLRR